MPLSLDDCHYPNLLIGLGGRNRLQPLLESGYLTQPYAVLVKPDDAAEWKDLPTIEVSFREDAIHRHFRRGCMQPGFLAELRALGFSEVVVPSFTPTTWRDNALEVFASEIADTVCLAPLDGGPLRRYSGENLHRLIYNKAYLASMLSAVPTPIGQHVLEVGCSDGLACDLMAQLGASKVWGVDLWTENVGSEYSSSTTEFRRDNADQLSFPDQQFDLTYSIATFEHLKNPIKVLQEMLRVTKIGGCVYVQAGPLYHSPFGHHMFSCFSDYPWAHLRLTPQQMVAHIQAKGRGDAVRHETGSTVEEYVKNMLSTEHINGLFLSQYHLQEFAAANPVEILKYNVSYEGKDLLSPTIQEELKAYLPEQLVQHGFEFCIRRTAP